MIRNPSLRRRLLLFVSIPLLAVLVGGGIINYVMGLHYANKVYDRWLLDSAEAIGDLVNSDAGRNELSDQARILLQFSVKERNEFAVRSLRYGVLAGNDDLPQPSPKGSQGSPVFTNFLDRGQPMRMASVFLANKADPGDVLVISTAETINKRRALARELLVSTVPIELLLIGVAMALVWLGINRGLRVLDPLAHEIRMREAGDLSPLRTIDAPLEVQPLVATIDALLGRLDRMLRQQQRFIADAAHQLRTPLAGLRLQAEHVRRDEAGEEGPPGADVGRVGGIRLADVRVRARLHDEAERDADEHGDERRDREPDQRLHGEPRSIRDLAQVGDRAHYRGEDQRHDRCGQQ